MIIITKSIYDSLIAEINQHISDLNSDYIKSCEDAKDNLVSLELEMLRFATGK